MHILTQTHIDTHIHTSFAGARLEIPANALFCQCDFLLEFGLFCPFLPFRFAVRVTTFGPCRHQLFSDLQGERCSAVVDNGGDDGDGDDGFGYGDDDGYDYGDDDRDCDGDGDDDREDNVSSTELTLPRLLESSAQSLCLRACMCMRVLALV
jgi:hypothetical protein